MRKNVKLSVRQGQKRCTEQSDVTNGRGEGEMETGIDLKIGLKKHLFRWFPVTLGLY